MWSETTQFLVVSLIFHLLYTYSIFDIYFTSPVVHPSRRFSASTALETIDGKSQSFDGPAKRLVLIVGDGLRADTLYKYHDSSMLPPWAEDDMLQYGRIQKETALNINKQWQSEKGASLATSFDAAPYLRKIALERGTWGLSHTRVPTESRPGHVALIAGMYEDVSAVTKGWKLNPVPFDSVFNQSSHTFSFGSPDILPMFARGATPGKVDMASYSEEAEDFTADASNLDIWVLERLAALIERARYNSTLKEQMTAPGTVFFLHLLGLDTTGHTYKPKSVEYIGNLMTVDMIVSEVESIFDDFFADDQTAFVFTADHGMSNKGNHGDGELDNTRTPLIAWGAGIQSPRSRKKLQEWRDLERAADEYYSNWGGLDQLWRSDVDQADVAPLMAALVGANMPANSEGVLPLDYLNLSKREAAKASLANARATLEMYRVKDELRRSRMIRYVPFPGLLSDENHPPGKISVETIQSLINKDSIEEALKECENLIRLSLEGARYLQTYDWLFLVGIVLIGYLGSILYGLLFLLRRYVLSAENIKKLDVKGDSRILPRLAVSSVLVIFISKFVIEKAPPTYYLYTSFAAFYWSRIVEGLGTFKIAWQSALHSQALPKGKSEGISGVLASTAIRITLSLLALEVMVYGYLHRLAWTAGFVIVGFIWPAVAVPVDVKTRHELLIILWTISCAICGTLTLSSIEKAESIAYLVTSGLLFLLAGGALVMRPSFFLSIDENSHNRKALARALRVLKILLGVLVICTHVTASSSFHLQQKRGLPPINQAMAWFILLFCIAMPFAYSFKSRRQGDYFIQASASYRLIIIIFSFAPIFVLLSIRDETIFFGCYSITLLLWTKLEGSLYEERQYAKMMNGQSLRATSQQSRRLEKEDVRIAIFFLFFLHVGFFGTGNIASISSFYLSPVYRLIPIFSPFLMATLLLLKILTPFIILASTFQLLCLTRPHPRVFCPTPRRTGLEIAGPPLFGSDSVGGLGLKDAYSLVLLACISTDVLAISFLVAVKTTGSWLEIGQSITHFAMANLLQVFILTLSAVADVIVGRAGSIDQHPGDVIRNGK